MHSRKIFPRSKASGHPSVQWFRYIKIISWRILLKISGNVDMNISNTIVQKLLQKLLRKHSSNNIKSRMSRVRILLWSTVSCIAWNRTIYYWPGQEGDPKRMKVRIPSSPRQLHIQATMRMTWGRRVLGKIAGSVKVTVSELNMRQETQRNVRKYKGHCTESRRGERP